jgi:diguanylate cyclase (GGDEF)-like protein
LPDLGNQGGKRLAGSVFIAFINPAVCAILAAALFVFWSNHPERRYIAVLGGGFGAMAVGFGLQFVSIESQFMPLRLLANGLLIVGATLSVAGTLGRYGIRPPLASLLLVAVGAILGYGWFFFVDPSIVGRIYVLNFGCGLLVLILAFELWKVKGKKPFDFFMVGLFATWGVHFFVRTPLAVMYDGTDIADASLFESLYWVTLTFSIAFFLLIFAVAIVAAIAIDLQEELRAESLTDPLSGLLNRRGFSLRLEETLSKAREQGLPLALVIADLDRFKIVNDRFGHAAGDEAIVGFADCLRQVISSDHVAGRMGGEEFAILLWGTDARAARLFAEGLRTSFAAADISGVPDGFGLTASFGVAALRQGEDWEILLRRADRALYRAKTGGRDRVVVCTGDEEPHLADDAGDHSMPAASGTPAAAAPGG